MWLKRPFWFWRLSPNRLARAGPLEKLIKNTREKGDTWFLAAMISKQQVDPRHYEIASEEQYILLTASRKPWPVWARASAMAGQAC
jgi:hypothetical protein